MAMFCGTLISRALPSADDRMARAFQRQTNIVACQHASIIGKRAGKRSGFRDSGLGIWGPGCSAGVPTRVFEMETGE